MNLVVMGDEKNGHIPAHLTPIIPEQRDLCSSRPLCMVTLSRGILLPCSTEQRVRHRRFAIEAQGMIDSHRARSGMRSV